MSSLQPKPLLQLVYTISAALIGLFTQLMTGIVLAIHKNTMQRLHLICQVGPPAQSCNSHDAPQLMHLASDLFVIICIQLLGPPFE